MPAPVQMFLARDAAETLAGDIYHLYGRIVHLDATGIGSIGPEFICNRSGQIGGQYAVSGGVGVVLPWSKVYHRPDRSGQVIPGPDAGEADVSGVVHPGWCS